MRTIVAGSRTINDYSIVKEAIENSGFDVSKVISGSSEGVDKLAEQWATDNGVEIERHPADWDKWGRSAGPMRNKEMADCADACIIVWDKSSKGTKNMLMQAIKNGLKLYVHDV